MDNNTLIAIIIFFAVVLAAVILRRQVLAAIEFLGIKLNLKTSDGGSGGNKNPAGVRMSRIKAGRNVEAVAKGGGVDMRNVEAGGDVTASSEGDAQKKA